MDALCKEKVCVSGIPTIHILSQKKTDVNKKIINMINNKILFDSLLAAFRPVDFHASCLDSADYKV